MTQREEQILSWIREEPLISQQELALRAGITRSSVAVHITHLMQKGFIRGRGYLLSDPGYVVVVGAVNVDISGTPETTYLPGDSNPGHVTVTMGGVGRNIAENLSRLGRRVVMITALGEDANAELVKRSCKEVGIDLSPSLTVSGGRTSTYLCLNDESGEIVGAVSDMAIYEALTPDVLTSRMDLLNRAALVVADGNLSRETLGFLARHLTAPLVADPVSVKKASHLQDALPFLSALKPNRAEASLLSGVSIQSHEDLPKAAQAFFKKGVKNVFISLGGEGVYYDDGSDRGILSCIPGALLNTNGCGDAFLAAAADGIMLGLSLRDCALRGLAASHICAQSPSAVSPDMSQDLIDAVLSRKED